MERLTVMGAGSWGTTLAWLLAGKGFGVTLWAREDEVRASIIERRENALFLPGVTLPGGITPTTSLKEAVEGARMVVSVVPSHGVREVFAEAAPHMAGGVLVVSATKGIEESSLLLPSAVLSEVLSGVPGMETAVISGPSFAKEVSRGLPAAVVAASASDEAALRVQEIFTAPSFRVYTSTDPLGVELGGAMKNVIAIASGISDGLSLGLNARAALITRGLAEIARLGRPLGARPETFYGLSGLGDLVLTCTGALSRNYTFGLEIGKGRSADEIASGVNTVAEGVRTSKAAASLARANSVEMPITEAVMDVLYNSRSPKEAVLALMARELKPETE